MIEGKTYYEILGVERDASPGQIKSAYKQKLLQWHPDRNHSKDAHLKCLQILEAYEVLKDPGKRRAYDLLLDIKEAAETETTEDFPAEQEEPETSEAPEDWRSEARETAAKKIRVSLVELLEELDEIAFSSAPKWVKWSVMVLLALSAFAWLGRIFYIRHPEFFPVYVLSVSVICCIAVSMVIIAKVGKLLR